ncbi:ed47654c-93d5-4bf4-9464-9de004bd847b [Thermothielavioides terrestris]|uniref:Ed47654c-93d5-4bf4-9464-9de004bd847b n=1 Tax=Thermothielavioides terrestris TaxID=2587410 RepID=A0A3S4ATJ9_9PEZI|nr:ed47654c-93d5-4bf4-9464-9de004bd847b [Thermothielavioides terrestris]
MSLWASYALGMFSWEDPNRENSFAITNVLVASTTYGLAAFLIWTVCDSKQRQERKNAGRVKSPGKLFQQEETWHGRTDKEG